MKKKTYIIFGIIAAIIAIFFLVPAFQKWNGAYISYDVYHGGTINTCQAITTSPADVTKESFITFAIYWWYIKLFQPQWWSINKHVNYMCY